MKLLKSLTWMVMIMLAIGFIGCSDDDDDDPVGPSQSDFEAVYEQGDAYFSAGTKNIKAADLYAEMQEANNNLFIIDWRSADDYNYAHIEGAVNYPVDQVVENLDNIPEGAKVVNVCYTGQNASHVTAAMQILGYDAHNLLFGMCGWTSDTDAIGKTGWHNSDYVKNIELSTTATPIPSETYDYPEIDGDFESLAKAYFNDKPNHVTADVVYADNNDSDDMNDWVVINYWPVEKYNHGHFPGAWQADAITMDLLSHIPADAKVAVYCYTGQTSSQLSAWLNTLGYDAWSMLYGMNAINPAHEDNKNFPGAADNPMVGEING